MAGLILLNMIASNSGGGLQNSLSFITSLSRSNRLHSSYIVSCVEGSRIHSLCQKLDIRCVVIKPGIFSRFIFELFGYLRIQSFACVTIVFTLFGNSPIIYPGAYKISGFAFSNILHKDIAFWAFLPLRKRLLKIAKDKFRLMFSLLSDEIILETAYLRNLAMNSTFKGKRISVVEMEASSLIPCDLGRLSLPIWTHKWTFLALSGPHPNKRLHLFAPILQSINQKRYKCGLTPAKLLVSFDLSHEYSNQIFREFKKCGCSDMLHFIGFIPPDRIASCLKSVDCLINISLLESFSNNWVEAWMARKPLIVTDASWSRASCQDAAIYIDPTDYESASEYISTALSDPVCVDKLLASGCKMLSKYNQGAKTDKYIDILNNALKALP